MPYSSADINAFMAIGMQSGLGTPQTTLSKLRYSKYLSGTNVQNMPEIVPLREGGDGHEWGYTYKQTQKAGGQLVINARPEITGQLLSLAPAGATYTPAAAPSGHNFHNGHASYPWSTFYVYHPGSALTHMLTDVRVGGITVEGESGQPWKLTLPFTAIQHGGSFNTTLAVPSYALEEPFLFHMGSYQVNGALATGFMSFKLDVAFGIEELQAAAVTLDEIVVQNKDTTIEFTQRFEDPTLWKNIAWSGGIVPTNSVPTGDFRAVAAYGTGAARRVFDINVPLIGYQTSEFTELDPDGQTVTLTTTGKALKGATSSLVMSLLNNHASAYAP